MPEPACDHLRLDHRAIEERLDTLLAALLDLTPERIPEIQAVFGQLRGLAAVHFETEEEIFYPKLRPLFAELLDRLDAQHEEVRELERHLADLLADPPAAPDGRWLNELRSFGIEFHDRIQHHIVDEEDQLFRLAGDRLLAEDQEALARAMEAIPGGPNPAPVVTAGTASGERHPQNEDQIVRLAGDRLLAEDQEALARAMEAIPGGPNPVPAVTAVTASGEPSPAE